MTRVRKLSAVLLAVGLVVSVTLAGLGPAPAGIAAAGHGSGIGCAIGGYFGDCPDHTEGIAVLNITGTADDSSIEVSASSHLGAATIKESGSTAKQNVSFTAYTDGTDILIASSGTDAFVALSTVGESVTIDGLTITLEDLYKESSTKTIDDDQTALDIYSAALSAEQSWSEFNTVMANYLMDSRTVAFAKAQAAAVEAMDAGDSQSQVISEARAVVEDYYSNREINYVKAWETKAQTVLQLSLRAYNESGVDEDLIDVYVQNGNYAWSDDLGLKHIRWNESVTESYTLVNGSNIVVQTIMTNETTSDVNNNRWELAPTEMIKSDGSIVKGVVWVDAVGTETSFKLLNTTTGADFMAELESASTQIEANAEQMVNGTYDRFQNGTLNATEFLNPLTLAQEYAQQYNETGYYAYAAAMLASLGYEVPDLNTTASMTIAYNGSEYTGLLMSQNAPSGGVWDSGQTYDTDLIPGVQLFASAENGTFEMDGTFQILSMQNLNGTEIQNTTTQKYVYHNVTNTEYITRQENVTELRLVLEGLEPPNTGGGGFGDLSQNQLILLAAAIAVIGYIGVKD